MVLTNLPRLRAEQEAGAEPEDLITNGGNVECVSLCEAATAADVL